MVNINRLLDSNYKYDVRIFPVRNHYHLQRGSVCDFNVFPTRGEQTNNSFRRVPATKTTTVTVIHSIEFIIRTSLCQLNY